MEAKLSFLFPTNTSSNKHSTQATSSNMSLVQINLAVPFAQQQPHLVSNLFYLITNKLPPSELLATLQVSQREIPFATPEEVRMKNNLKSFKEMCVVRIDVKEGVVELGSSSSKSIFGGFINDEKLPESDGTTCTSINSKNAHANNNVMLELANKMRSLRAGTLLCGNIGIMNSNGSRYYLLLRDMNIINNNNNNNNNNNSNSTVNYKNGKNDAAENPYSSCIPLGFVTSGFEQFSSALANVPVQPRVLLPLKKVELVECEVDFVQTLTCHVNGNNNNNNSSISINNTAEPIFNVAANSFGSVTHNEEIDRKTNNRKSKRSREDEDEEIDSNNNNINKEEQQERSVIRAIDGKSSVQNAIVNNNNATNTFFHFNARFPTPQSSQYLLNSMEQQTKRRRVDTSCTPSNKHDIPHNATSLQEMSASLESPFSSPFAQKIITNGSNTDDSNNVNINSNENITEPKFDYFKVQNNVLINDLLHIQETQGQRQRRHAKRNAKQSKLATSKYNNLNNNATTTATVATTAAVKRKKFLNKRY